MVSHKCQTPASRLFIQQFVQPHNKVNIKATHLWSIVRRIRWHVNSPRKENIKTSLFLNPTNETEIKNAISQLKEGAPGRDGIASKNIKHIKDSISYPLINIINLSFEQGVFPSELKSAVITPLYKAKDPMFFNNYRPISFLSVFSKIIERLMYSRLLNFINRHKIFNQIQVRFRNNHSTFMALIILVENLLDALDDRIKLCRGYISGPPESIW